MRGLSGKKCPLNLECKLVQTIELTSDEVFIGEVVEVYAESRFITENLPDISKIDPIVYSMYDHNYWRIGECMGKAFQIGKV